MDNILFFLLLLSTTTCYSQSNLFIKGRISQADSLSGVVEKRVDYIEKSWIGGTSQSGSCKRPPLHGVAYKDILSGLIEKVVVVEDSTQTRQVLYLNRGELYKVVVNNRAFYLIGQAYYQQSGGIESDTLMLRQFSLDINNIKLLKAIM